MKYVSIPSVPLPVSRIVLGGSSSVFSSGGDIAPIMESALQSGINTVDTAREYGRSEEAVGRWLRSHGKREDLVLISKCCHPCWAFVSRVSKQAAADDLKRSLDTLQTDHIDIYLLHRDNESVPVGRIVDFLNRFHEEGKIGAFGGSNWTAKRIAEANAYAGRHGLTGFSVSSPHCSLGRQRHDPWGNGCKTVTGEKNAPQRAYYQETQMAVLAWSSLCGGVFSGKLKAADWGRIRSVLDNRAWWAYGGPDNRERLARCEQLARDKDATVAQVALAWLLTGEMNVLPVIGASGPARVRENAAAADLALSQRERAYLDLQSSSL